MNAVTAGEIVESGTAENLFISLVQFNTALAPVVDMGAVKRKKINEMTGKEMADKSKRTASKKN